MGAKKMFDGGKQLPLLLVHVCQSLYLHDLIEFFLDLKVMDRILLEGAPFAHL
jgi:hypothetical protein